MEKVKVGIAGVGLMGLGIATNIVKGGWPLTFLDHAGNQSTVNLLSAGANNVATGKMLALECDIIILCVTGAPQVDDILTRDDGILAGIRKGSCIIDCSTSIPATTIKLAQKVTDAGGRFVDAPMTRTPKEAMEGRLNLIVGGERKDFERVLPLLQTFAENITHVGGIGSGHSMKLLHNYVSLGFTAVLAEAAATAALAGIDKNRFIEVLAKGGGGSVVLDRLSPFILNDDPSGLKFSISNAHKDIGYYNEMAENLDAQVSTAKGLFDLLDHQMEAGNGQLLLPQLVKLLQK